MLRMLVSFVFCGLALFAQAPSGDKKPEDKKPDAPKEKAFQEVIKGARESGGLFPTYRTEEDKVYLELRPEQFEKVYILALTCDSGIGERGLFAAAMCGEVPVVFHRNGKQVQMLARNTAFTAQSGTAIRRAVDRSFSDSILGSAKLESQPHPDRKSVLIDLGAILLTDLPMLGYDLEARFRIPYRFDLRNSSFGAIRGFDQNVEIETIAHYAVERPPVPPLMSPGAPPPPHVPPPRTLPDMRSMLLRLRYSLLEVPQTPGFRPRMADDRIGHFVEQVEDFSTDRAHLPTRRYINRWALEKADPSAALSRPKKPIVFWLENTVPEEYRNAIREGVLLWNKAFEKIGFRDVIEVKQQPDQADWDAADVRYNTIRWITTTDAVFAQGPARANPFTGELYDADIRFAEAMTRFRRRDAREGLAPLAAGETEMEQFLAPWSRVRADQFCNYIDNAVRDAEFSFDVLTARGLDPDGPEADKFVNDWLREIAAHEVGHTLGLRHNFRASSIHNLEELQNTDLTGRNGLTGSVMDYIPVNIAAKGGTQGEYAQSTLGPYDYWAIEYAYKPIDAATPEAELAELRKIASRASEPMLAYGTDEDAGFGPNGFDMDPLVNRNDLTADPLQFAAHRVRLAREVFDGMESKLEKPGEGYQVLRRSFLSALGQMTFQLAMASKFIGGVHHYRDHVGDPGGRLPYNPVPAVKQRETLNLLNEQLFAASAFNFSPRLLRKLNVERFTDFRSFEANVGRLDLPVHEIVLRYQKIALDRLFHPVVLSRVIDSEALAGQDAFRLGELFTGLQNAIWSETRQPAGSVNITSYRRSLQREHLRKLMNMVLRDASVPEDARSLARYGLGSLKGQLQRAVAVQGIRLETRAHLEETISRIDEALAADLQRTAL